MQFDFLTTVINSWYTFSSRIARQLQTYISRLLTFTSSRGSNINYGQDLVLIQIESMEASHFISTTFKILVHAAYASMHNLQVHLFAV